MDAAGGREPKRLASDASLPDEDDGVAVLSDCSMPAKGWLVEVGRAAAELGLLAFRTDEVESGGRVAAGRVDSKTVAECVAIFIRMHSGISRTDCKLLKIKEGRMELAPGFRRRGIFLTSRVTKSGFASKKRKEPP